MYSYYQYSYYEISSLFLFQFQQRFFVLTLTVFILYYGPAQKDDPKSKSKKDRKKDAFMKMDPEDRGLKLYAKAQKKRERKQVLDDFDDDDCKYWELDKRDIIMNGQNYPFLG